MKAPASKLKTLIVLERQTKLEREEPSGNQRRRGEGEQYDTAEYVPAGWLA